MNQSFGSTSKRRKPSINITSLIDVMFLLLIFFMVSSTFKEESEALDITLPRAGTSQAQSLDFSEIGVNSEGNLFLDGSIVDQHELRNSLKTIIESDPQAKVVVRGDTVADFGKVMAAIDIAREMGVVNVIIATDPLEEAPVAP
jgi:biopolymer transport protein ExbD